MGKLYAFAMTAAMVMLVLAPPARAQDDAERAKICEKAEQRYQKLFGKPSGDEDVTIVKMYKYTFCPQHLKIKKGAKVRWVNVDKRTSHSVWFQEQGGKESDRIFAEETVNMVLDLPPGVNPYICGPHWEQQGMRGTITIEP